MEYVRWHDAQEFVERLNQGYPGLNYRLPTEGEWEYAARAGTKGDYEGTGVLDGLIVARFDRTGRRVAPRNVNPGLERIRYEVRLQHLFRPGTRS